MYLFILFNHGNASIWCCVKSFLAVCCISFLYSVYCFTILTSLISFLNPSFIIILFPLFKKSFLPFWYWIGIVFPFLLDVPLSVIYWGLYLFFWYTSHWAGFQDFWMDFIHGFDSEWTNNVFWINSQPINNASYCIKNCTASNISSPQVFVISSPLLTQCYCGVFISFGWVDVSHLFGSQYYPFEAYIWCFCLHLWIFWIIILFTKFFSYPLPDFIFFFFDNFIPCFLNLFFNFGLVVFISHLVDLAIWAGFVRIFQWSLSHILTCLDNHFFINIACKPSMSHLLSTTGALILPIVYLINDLPLFQITT